MTKLRSVRNARPSCAGFKLTAIPIAEWASTVDFFICSVDLEAALTELIGTFTEPSHEFRQVDVYVPRDDSRRGWVLNRPVQLATAGQYAEYQSRRSPEQVYV